MSFKSVEWVMHMTPTKGRPGDKFVLVTLAWHKNEQTGKCCPSIPLLMSETGMSRDFIRDALKRLTAAGLIKVSRTPGGRTDYLLVEGSNGYRVPTTTGEQLLPGEGSNGYRGRGVTATPNMEVNKELNKEGENPLPPPSPLARRKTHLFDLEELPPEWKTYCEEVRPDLDPDKVFTDFSFYWSSGRGSGTRRSDKGWAASWQTWVRKEKENGKNKKQDPATADLNSINYTPDMYNDYLG